MLNKNTLKRYLVWAIITSLVASAVVGILVVLFGSFGWLEGKILLTTLAIGVFSITGLANLRNLESDHQSYRRFAWTSISFSLIALLLTLSMIWVSVEGTPWKPTIIFFILAVSTAHASLLLPSRSRTVLLDVAVTATLACIAFVAGFLIYLVLRENAEVGELAYRLLGVFAILDVLGTIIVPVLAKFVSRDNQAIPTHPTNIPLTGPVAADGQLNQSQEPENGTPDRI